MFRLYLADVFAYKASAFIWVLGDLQLALMMPIVWRAVGGLQGYSVEQVTAYYIVTMTISQFVTCHLLWDIGFDIREGAFTSMLVRPVSYLTSSFARNMAWRIGKVVLFVPFLLVLLPAYGFSNFTSLRVDATSVAVLFLGQTIAFLSAYCVAMLAMWTTEFVSIFQLYYFPELLLSGRVVPLEALPSWAQYVAQWSHFRYTVSFPAEAFLGRLTEAQLQHGAMAQCLWIAVFLVFAKVLFNLGLKQYSGFGM